MERKFLKDKWSFWQIRSKYLLKGLNLLQAIYKALTWISSNLLSIFDRFDYFKLYLLDRLLHTLSEQFPLVFSNIKRFNLALLHVEFTQSRECTNKPFNFLLLDCIFEIRVLIRRFEYFEENEVFLHEKLINSLFNELCSHIILLWLNQLIKACLFLYGLHILYKSPLMF